MIRFSANLSTLFTDRPFLDRFPAARDAGFSAIECWYPYDHSPPALKAVLADNGLTMVGINVAPGAEGEWGLAALPGREEDFRTSIRQALEYAAALGSAVHVLAGLVGSVERRAAAATYYANLAWAAEQAEKAKVQLLIEPLNGKDRPGYFLSRSDQAAEVVSRAGLQSLKIMFDCYHVQLEEGGLINRLRQYRDLIGHIQIAGVPDRGEPDRGEVNYPNVLAAIEAMGWEGWIGLEYFPKRPVSETFGWLRGFQSSLVTSSA